MNIALVQSNLIIADFLGNTKKILNAIQQAYTRGADLVVFPELAIGGYPAYDLNKDEEFQQACLASLDTIAAACTDLTCILGSLHRDNRGLFNAAYVLRNGKVDTVITKKHLRHTIESDEREYFDAGTGVGLIKINERSIAVALGEDGDLIPAGEESSLEAEAMLVLNNRAFSYLDHPGRLARVSTLSKRLQIPVGELNTVGGQGEVLFSGGSLVVDAGGQLLDEAKSFEEDLRMYRLEEQGITALQETEGARSLPGLLHDALIMGIQDFFRKQGFSKAVVGLSGGLDSALVATLASQALGPENLHCLLMPSEFSTSHSVRDAEDLVANLGCEHTLLPIRDIYDTFKKTLLPLFKDLPFGLAEENLQARSRGSLVMAVSNKFGGIVLNTSNKSEAAMGYGTLYGDLVGSLSVLGDVYKTQAYEIARYINQDKVIIPEHIIIKPPSAELRPGQKDSDSLPEYDRLDPVLFQYVDQKRSVSEICAQGYERAFVLRIVQVVDGMEFKRHQAPPILGVSDCPFGRGRRIPEVKRVFPLQ